MPLYRRLPKRGFNNAAFKTKVAIVNLESLNQFAAGSTVTEEQLRLAGLVRGAFHQLKLLASGELKVALTVEVDTASAAAKAAMEKAGGKVTIRQKVSPAASPAA
jgi:large subunit ribosomal protein L15